MKLISKRQRLGLPEPNLDGVKIKKLRIGQSNKENKKLQEEIRRKRRAKAAVKHILSKKKNSEPKNFKRKLQIRADVLNILVPRSEKWFREKFEPIKIKSDLYNEPFKWCIPNVLNKVYKYVIEIDGSIHNTKGQQERDGLYTSRGYRIFRIKAYDEEALAHLIEEIKKIRMPKPRKLVIINE